MLLCEIANSKFNPLLVAFWQSCTPTQLKHYFVRDNCIDASRDLNEFLESRGIMTGDVIGVGSWVGDQKRRGWVHVDTPDTSRDAFTSAELKHCVAQGLNPSRAGDRLKYIVRNHLEEAFCWIPHSWVEVRGEVLDPSGFYLDHVSGQFDRMVLNHDNLAARYQYF